LDGSVGIWTDHEHSALVLAEGCALRGYISRPVLFIHNACASGTRNSAGSTTVPIHIGTMNPIGIDAGGSINGSSSQFSVAESHSLVDGGDTTPNPRNPSSVTSTHDLDKLSRAERDWLAF
jgi:hypothetical protein